MRFLRAGLGVSAIVTAGLLAASASATSVDGYDMYIGAGGDHIYLSDLEEGEHYSYTGSDNGYGGTYLLLAPVVDAEGAYEITAWESEFDTDPFVTNNLSVTNTSGSAQSFVFTVTSPVAPPLGSTTMDGSIGITITNTLGAVTLSSTSPNAVYIARLDGASVQTLFNDPYSLTCGTAFCSTTQNTSFGPVAGPGVTTNMGIDIRFTLSPGDSATITSVFNIVSAPEPATAALLALGLLALVAHRRRT